MKRATSRLERIAHRGASRERPENTMAAFALALERGADAVELDVHVTADARVLVRHDDVVSRRQIARTPWAELRDLEVGDGETMPLLEDVLDFIGDRATVYVEVKAGSGEDVVAN